MAKLSLREIKQSQLDAAPVVDGQLVFCTDTGNLYRDVGSARMRAGSDIEIVSELPLAPIEGKVYCLRGGDMWLYEGGDWLKLNQYTHPTTSGNKHIPAGGKSGQVVGWSADGTGTWVDQKDTTYDVVTDSAPGLMSAAEHTKLAGIAAGANNYSHPTYTAKASGLYKVTVDGTGHVSGTAAVSKGDITALGIPGTNTTYNNATQSSAGLMSSTDKKKLDSVDMANACMYDGTSTSISEFQTTCDYIDGGAY